MPEVPIERSRYERDELLAISRALSSERDIRKLLDLVLDKSRRITGADAGSVVFARQAINTASNATTLTVSPYQDHEAIVEAGQRACAEERIRFVVTDYRDRYGAATRRSRELGMYRQNYCGCVLSEAEARRERAARKEARAARTP